MESRSPSKTFFQCISTSPNNVRRSRRKRRGGGTVGDAERVTRNSDVSQFRRRRRATLIAQKPEGGGVHIIRRLFCILHA